MVSIVVEKYNTAVFNLLGNSFADIFGCGRVFPIKRINIIYKSKDFFTKSLKRLLLHIMSQCVKICMVHSHP